MPPSPVPRNYRPALWGSQAGSWTQQWALKPPGDTWMLGRPRGRDQCPPLAVKGLLGEKCTFQKENTSGIRDAHLPRRNRPHMLLTKTTPPSSLIPGEGTTGPTASRLPETFPTLWVKWGPSPGAAWRPQETVCALTADGHVA